LYFKDKHDTIPDWMKGFVRRLQCKCRDKENKRNRTAAKYDTENKPNRKKLLIEKQDADAVSHADKKVMVN
jgi:hypothetical protein